MPLNEGRRPQLRQLTQTPSDCHPGMWLDYFLTEQTWHLGEKEPQGYDKETARKAKDDLIQQVVQKSVSSDYKHARDLWLNGLDSDRARVVYAEVATAGRVIVGIGQKGPAEFGLTLHHTWGVPVLPGSSLKGIASLGADRYLSGDSWRRRADSAKARDGGANHFDALFGDVEEQGAVIFHDAWFIPGADCKNGLHHDVLTVHHPDYYQKEAAPSDMDSPIPVPFVSVKGKFLIALELNPALDEVTHGHWLRAAWEALRAGLARHGVGSKTNAGYGRIELPEFDQAPSVLKVVEAENKRKKQEDDERKQREAAAEAEVRRKLQEDRKAAEIAAAVQRETKLQAAQQATTAAAALDAWIAAGVKAAEIKAALGDWLDKRPEDDRPAAPAQNLRAYERTPAAMTEFYSTLKRDTKLSNEVHSLAQAYCKILREAKA